MSKKVDSGLDQAKLPSSAMISRRDFVRAGAVAGMGGAILSVPNVTQADDSTLDDEWELEATTAPANMNCFTDPISGFEVCQSADGSIVIFNSGSSRIRFRAFRDFENWPPRWRSGVRVTTREVSYQAVQIDSHHYFEANENTCAPVAPLSEGDFNDDAFASFEWGTPGTPEPIRVNALVRAQWNGKRIRTFVSAGPECFVESEIDFPAGYPDDWPPLPDIIVTPLDLTLNTSPSRPTATGSLTIRNTFPDPRRVTMGGIEVTGVSGGSDETGTAAGTFDAISGDLELQPNSERQVEVSFTFIGTAQLGSVTARMPISWAGGGQTVQLTGRRLQEAVIVPN